MMKSKIKAFAFFVIAFSAIIPLVLSTMTFADVGGKKPSELAKISFYRDAMNTCIKGIDTSTLANYINNNDDVAYRTQQERELFSKLSNGQIFGATPYVYSDTLAKLMNQSDGRISCGVNNNSLMSNAFNSWGVSMDVSNLKSLYCDGKKPGILRIIRSPIREVDGNDRNEDNQILDDSDCSASFDLLQGYTGSGSRGYVISVDNSAITRFPLTAKYPLNPSSHFENWFSSKVGDLSQTEASKTGALKYAKAALNFSQLCTASGSGPFTEDPKAGDRAVQIYDGFSGQVRPDQKVWYVIPDEISMDQTFMTNITNSTGSTCSQMAAVLQKNPKGAQAYAKLEYTADENGDPTNQNGLANGSEDDGSGSSEPTLDDACYDSGVVSMGWLVCPVISNSAHTIDPIEYMIKEMLEVKTGLYGLTDDDGDESATYQAWNIIRNVANVVLVILFLAIIFSQITGYGIDNYGIKKLLPKLIISAILINLSYIICEIAIDLSNILGQGLSNLFQNIASDIETKVDVNGGGEFIVGLVTVLLGATAAAGAFSGTIVSIVDSSSDKGMMSIIIGLALLVALVAVLMFFVMLGARMVIIVGCVAISPIAFACNLLPNTQTFFKKWLKIMEVCLIMYPICGAVYGLSFIIRSIIFSTGTEIHFWEGIIAIIAPFLPFFFLPSLLKGAISGLGAIGAALTGIASSAKGGMQSGINAIQNSDSVQTRQRLAQQQHTASKFNELQGKIKKIRDKGEQPSDALLIKAGRLGAANLRNQKENREIMEFANGNKYRAAEAAQEAGFLQQDIEAQKSLLEANQFTIGEGDKAKVIDPNNIADLQAALGHELSLSAEKQDYTRAAALYNQLLGKGNGGLGAIGNVLNGNSGHLAYGDATRRIINDMVNNKDIKDKERSAYSVATQLQTDLRKASSAADFHFSSNQVTKRLEQGSDLDDIKYEQVADLTDEQFKGLSGGYGYADPEQQEKAANLMESALNDSQVLSRMDGNKRVTSANAVAKNILDAKDAQHANAFMKTEGYRYASSAQRQEIETLAKTYEPPATPVTIKNP